MSTPTPKSVLDMLRKLPQKQRLRVISQASPELVETRLHALIQATQAISSSVKFR